ncbi:MAG: primosomal protein N' [Verrucomicrobia bacterium]|nr:primosomal protein N' [Verrucomicrobiota bacterium]MBU6445976.1 primosomal protein N' [Verrucomicrobiota bacterium]MDE3047750.1 primosomal protein N' [Verrucomicrobiota bacterium]
MSKMFVEVLLDQNLAKALDYAVPDNVRVEVGMRVEVPLKSTLKKGTIAKIKESSSLDNVKPIVRVLSAAGELSEPQWKLAHWMAHYYAAPLQRVLKCFIPVNVRKAVREKTQIFLKVAKTHDECIRAIEQFRRKAPAKAIALEEILKSPKGAYLADLQISKSAVTTLVKEQWITAQSVKLSADLLLEEEFFPTSPKLLNAEQQKCVEAIQASLEKKAFAAHLIYGVTGSGKTEVYMQAIRTALEQNRSAMMLVPEISLTSQTIERFKARFSERIAVLHHRRSLGERTSAWEDLRKGDAKLVIGARSALFCPAQNLGLIIVDEEHDSSYKQSDEIPCYHGRDVAVMRAHMESCTVLLGSATPSIESRYNASIGKYQLHELHQRATAAPMPKIKIVDMSGVFERNQGFTHFSEELLGGIKKRLSMGEQTLLFLNKRGYHRMQICSSCRYLVKCPHCDLTLTFHKSEGFLQCHLCGHRQPIVRNCPHCQSTETLGFKGFGTEHVERSLHAIFPEVRTLRMDRDTTMKKNSHEEMFKQFRAHKADVLIGTQMIAKGFHFPSVTLVGVLNPDATLNIPDFRSPEQVFQLMTQVAGRAGRAELNGEVIIQTFLPDHPTLKWAATQDYLAFYRAEIEERKRFGYPPFCHLVKLLFTHSDEEEARQAAETAYQRMKTALPPPCEILPVMPAGHAKVKDLYRFQFVIKVLKVSSISAQLTELTGAKIDVDPISVYF